MLLLGLSGNKLVIRIVEWILLSTKSYMKLRLFAFILFGAECAYTLFGKVLPRAMLLCRAWCCEAREEHNSFAVGRLERGFRWKNYLAHPHVKVVETYLLFNIW